MSSGTAQAWFIAGTIPLMVAGGLHVVLTVLDTARPTIAVLAAYLAISLVFWFYVPALATATACFIVAAVLTA